MPESIDIRVTLDQSEVKTISAESSPTPFGRGAPIGMRSDGILYAGFATEGPGLESVLVSSSDGGRNWSRKRLDWWQFQHRASLTETISDPVTKIYEPESALSRFFNNRRFMNSDAFGVLKNGTLLWVFEESPKISEYNHGTTDCYIIRSEDGGETWEDPFILDKQGFPCVGNNSNRMTELPDGTLLWPVRLGVTQAELAKMKSKGIVKKPSSVTGSHVFRSSDSGRTWGDITPLPDWCWENTLLRLNSGKLIAALRYQPFLDDESPQDTKTLFLADSDDGGRTWEDFRPIRLTPDGPQALEFGQCHGELSELSDGTIVVVYDHRYPYQKQQVLARISRDQGKTWLAEVYHLTKPGGSVLGSTERGYGGGYASSVVLEDDTIVTITGTGNSIRWRVE